MQVIILRTLVYAERQTVWNTLLDSLQNPQKYSPDLKNCRIVKSTEAEVIREIQTSDTAYREYISLNSVDREICRGIADHPTCSGNIVIKAVPTSVQNPMAPVDLQYFVEFETKGEKESLISSLIEEQRRLKEASEKVEKYESRRRHYDR